MCVRARGDCVRNGQTVFHDSLDDDDDDDDDSNADNRCIIYKR